MELANAAALLANFVLVPALSYGSQLALGALGITLIFGILRFANFAHGDLMAFGTMAVVLATWQLQAWGVTIAPLPTALLALPFGILATVLLSLAADRVVFRFYRVRKSPPVVLAIVSVGLMFVLNGAVRMIIGPDDQVFLDGTRFLATARDTREAFGIREGIAIRYTQVVTLAAAAISVVATFWFLQRTRLGKSMRAYADNEELALLSGVRPERVVAVTWILAATLAAIAGTPLRTGQELQTVHVFPVASCPCSRPRSWAASVSPWAPSPAASSWHSPKSASRMRTRSFSAISYRRKLEPDGLVQFLSTDYKFAISFIILVTVLLIRPTGIFRGRAT